MDKKGRLFGKISIVDLLVILLVLVVAGGTIYRFTADSTRFDDGDVTINYTIRVEGVRAFTVYYYHAGLRVYERMSNQFIGNIEDFRVVPHYQIHSLEDGSMVREYFPDTHVNIYIDITSPGRQTPYGYFAQGTFEVAANSITNIRTRYVQVEGTIHSVSAN